MREINLYQVYRRKIPYYRSFQSFKNYIFKLNDNEKLGLTREWRAYYWLKRKYKNDRVAISSSYEDINGIDLVIERGDEFNQEFIYFAVSGERDHEDHKNCHYKIIVTSNKIYQKNVKGGKNEKHRNKRKNNNF